MLDDATECIASKAVPGAGDFSICMYCGVILRFTDTLALRRVGEVDLAELRMAQPATLELLLHSQRVVQGFALKRKQKSENIN
jgi:hypothetical protein